MGLPVGGLPQCVNQERRLTLYIDLLCSADGCEYTVAPISVFSVSLDP